jgi:hypothetical protein
MYAKWAEIYDAVYSANKDYNAEIATSALFTHDDFYAAFRAAAMPCSFNEAGLMKRGLWIGVRDA